MLVVHDDDSCYACGSEGRAFTLIELLVVMP
jgi:hypothetical protein